MISHTWYRNRPCPKCENLETVHTVDAESSERSRLLLECVCSATYHTGFQLTRNQTCHPAYIKHAYARIYGVYVIATCISAWCWWILSIRKLSETRILFWQNTILGIQYPSDINLTYIDHTRTGTHQPFKKDIAQTLDIKKLDNVSRVSLTMQLHSFLTASMCAHVCPSHQRVISELCICCLSLIITFTFTHKSCIRERTIDPRSGLQDKLYGHTCLCFFRLNVCAHVYQGEGFSIITAPQLSSFVSNSRSSIFVNGRIPRRKTRA